jgi:hypothetical protein
LLRFDFAGGNPEGTLELLGTHLVNAYSLPLSGYAKSFGVTPPASSVLLVDNDSAARESISFRFAPSGASDFAARVTTEKWSGTDSAIQILSQTPFHARVCAERDCYLETPKLYLPGYQAVVDGKPAPVVRSGEGLVAVPLSRGEHQVTILFPGSRLLRWSYTGSAIAWLGLGVIVMLYAFRREQRFEHAVAFLVGAGAARVVWAAGIGGALALVFLGLEARRSVSPAASRGSVRMTVRLPWPEPGKSEPLVTTGKTGAGDFIYVIYVDGKHVRVGHDRWGYGGAVSEPIAVDYATTQMLEISLGALPGGQPGQVVTFRWNGSEVLRDESGVNPAGSDQIWIGENPIGGSTTTMHFSGRILSVTPAPPADRL